MEPAGSSLEVLGWLQEKAPKPQPKKLKEKKIPEIHKTHKIVQQSQLGGVMGGCHLQNFARCPAARGSTPALNSSSGPKTCRMDGEDEWMDGDNLENKQNWERAAKT